MGHVPALWIDGRTLAESVAILEYLEETRPAPPLYPKDHWARARVRQVVELVNAGIQPLQNTSVQKHLSPDPAVQAEWTRFFNVRGLAAAEALLGTIAGEIPGAGHFAVGGALTAADVFLVPQVATARRYGVDVAAYPRVLAGGGGRAGDAACRRGAPGEPTRGAGRLRFPASTARGLLGRTSTTMAHGGERRRKRRSRGAGSTLTGRGRD